VRSSSCDPEGGEVCTSVTRAAIMRGFESGLVLRTTLCSVRTTLLSGDTAVLAATTALASTTADCCRTLNAAPAHNRVGVVLVFSILFASLLLLLGERAVCGLFCGDAGLFRGYIAEGIRLLSAFSLLGLFVSLSVPCVSRAVSARILPGGGAKSVAVGASCTCDVSAHVYKLIEPLFVTLSASSSRGLSRGLLWDTGTRDIVTIVCCCI